MVCSAFHLNTLANTLTFAAYEYHSRKEIVILPQTHHSKHNQLLAPSAHFHVIGEARCVLQ